MLALQNPVSQRFERGAGTPTRTPGEEALWRAPATAAAHNLREPDCVALSALGAEALSGRFKSWRGASGRRYIFSVYDWRCCPAYCDAVFLAIAVGRDGQRRILAIADTGAFPEPVVANAAARFAHAGGRVEFHVHLLAASPANRRETIADLAALAPHACRS